MPNRKNLPTNPDSSISTLQNRNSCANFKSPDTGDFSLLAFPIDFSILPANLMPRIWNLKKIISVLECILVFILEAEVFNFVL